MQAMLEPFVRELGDVREELGRERERRERLQQERDELRRELTSLRETREAPETVAEELDRAEPRSATTGLQTGAQRPQSGGLRGLRRRILGW